MRVAVEAAGELAVSCAGIGWAERTVGKQGAAQLTPFETVVRVNLIGTFNVLRLAAAAIAASEPDEEGERGAVVMTASIAAYEGQIGQTAYAASRAASSASPCRRRVIWRDSVSACARSRRACSTPRFWPGCPRKAGERWARVPFPARPRTAAGVCAAGLRIAENSMLNGEVIRLDGALRMAQVAFHAAATVRRRKPQCLKP